jgi:hypothetical protein
MMCTLYGLFRCSFIGTLRCNYLSVYLSRSQYTYLPPGIPTSFTRGVVFRFDFWKYKCHQRRLSTDRLEYIIYGEPPSCHQQTNTKLFYFSTFSDPRVETYVALLITKRQMWLKCLLRTSHISLMNDRV